MLLGRMNAFQAFAFLPHAGGSHESRRLGTAAEVNSIGAGGHIACFFQFHSPFAAEIQI